VIVTDDRTRVVYLAHTFEVGGAEDVVLNLVRHLPDRFEPIVGCIHDLGPIGHEIRAAGIPVTALGLNPGLRRPWDVARIRRFLRRTRPRIVHTFLLPASLYGRLAAMLARVPIVIGSEMNIYERKRPRHALAERLLMSGTDRVVAAAQSVRDFYIRQIHADPAKVDVIYNAVDWAHLERTADRDQTRRSLGIPADAAAVVVIGRLTEQKGHAYLFDALAHTPSLDRVHLVVAGDGDLRETLRDCAAALGISSRVHFVGVRRDVGNLLHAIDVFVLPSLWEGLPLALVLAMGAGVPVVSTRVGGVPEIVEDGRTGLLVPPGDAAALGDAVARLIGDPARARGLAEAARAEVRPKFGVDGYVASVVGLYDRLLGERAA
jgi:glycosyltransferase involved in cell wall biosynthesis